MEGNGSSALAVIESQPHSSIEANVGVLMRRATDVAGVCREIVMKTAMDLQGKKYVKVEGWQSIAVAFGCVASSRNVERVAGGFRSIGEIRRMSDGAVIATAEGFVSEDEPVWFGGGLNKKTGKPYERRPESAIRAMAQTRSISRACRSAFSFIVTLIDGKLSTTPAEEMDFVEGESGTVEPPPPTGSTSLKEKLRQPAASPPRQDASAAPQSEPGEDAEHDRNFVMPFANKNSEPLSALSEKSLKWFKGALTENIANPEKARFADAARSQLRLIEAEISYRGL